jgi:RNA polymerase sigma factor (sigma-70 family)
VARRNFFFRRANRFGARGVLEGVSKSTHQSSEEFRAFVEAEYAHLVRAVALVTGSLAGAEDAVQEALARGWERTLRGEIIESLGKWTVTVALNLARNGARRVARWKKVTVRLDQRSAADPQEIAVTLDVRRSLMNLPLRQREVTVLHYYLGLPVADIAAALDLSEGTVKSALHRSRSNLAKQLGGFNPQEVTDV